MSDKKASAMPWEKIPGWERYEINANGEIRSLWNWRGKRSKPRLIKACVQAHGYSTVCLYNGEKQKRQFRLHRLVAKVFLNNPDELPEVNHKNGDKADNRSVNLEWCSRLHNAQHAKQSGRYQFGRKANRISKLSLEQVKEIKSLLRSKMLTQAQTARNYGVTEQVISRIALGRTWKWVA